MHKSALSIAIGSLLAILVLASSARADCRQGFDAQPSFNGDCKARPSGSTCVKFSDQYIWLIFDSVGGWREETCGRDKIEVAIGFQGQYSHIKGTNLVRFEELGIETVGGLTTGFTAPLRVVCANLTTGQTISFSIQGPFWDCEAVGLVVNRGDKIRLTVTGRAK